uniref:Eukaryotic elongation factor 2 kinase n=1 Tax=Hemiscolopendra marginata TaxID=943146 RepID=A0A646QD63_9MYRI
MKDKSSSKVECDDDDDDDDTSDMILDPISVEDFRQVETVGCSVQERQGEIGNKERNTSVGIVSGKERRRRISQMNASQRHWYEALLKLRDMKDPWEKFHLDDYATEAVVRHRYNTLQKSWVKDEVLVKMEPEPFNHGAMRECYRMRKITKYCHSNKWKTATNYVAKRYMDDVDRNIYFEDVKLQMDAKLWGEEFNRHNPPKKIDIFQMAVLEFIKRPGKPLFHVEHFIEGNYIKYNSNSGYVTDDVRFTPQAFSHFTFERSGHELIVVDIQGVGDLYTDPQIHTAGGKEYGDGNLGTRGMALFFHSHECNIICDSLGLSRFDLTPSEEEIIKHHDSCDQDSVTYIRGTEELCMLPSQYERTHLHEFLRTRSLSSGNDSMHELSPHGNEGKRTFSECSQGSSENDNCSDNDSGVGSVTRHRIRRITDSGSLTEEIDKQMFHNFVEKLSRPSCVHREIEMRKLREDASRSKTGGSVLGQIHLDLAKYHEMCRFTSVNGSYDKASALFHLQHAADCGNLEAICNLARIYLNLVHDILVDIEMEPTEKNISEGLDYLQLAAEAGDRASMIYLAQAYDTGYNLGLRRERSWKEAVYWYNQATNTDEHDESGNYDHCMDNPKYLLLARQAEMYKEGLYCLEQDLTMSGELFQEAGNEAMNAMKGRLANKYFSLAEEVWSEIDE